MHIVVNGESMEINDQVNVQGLLQQLDLGDRPCAVEVNQAVVPRRTHSGCTLADGDVIEIVTLVGGG